MRLHHQLLRAKPERQQGFSLTELMVAASIGVLLSLVAGDALISHIQSNARLESLERLRSDWSRTSHFIESEVALSERVLTNPNSVNLNQCSPSITAEEFRFALEIRRDLPPVIYFIRSNEDNTKSLWNGTHSLFRCGPGIDENGNYTDIITGSTQATGSANRVIDGLSNSCGIKVMNISETSKSLRIELCMNGISTQTLKGETSTYSRVSPIFSYPNANSLCSEENLSIEGFYKLSGGNSSQNTLSVPQNAVPADQDVLICGYGGSDNITGSTANDVLEAGDLAAEDLPGAAMDGQAGNDRLLGGGRHDILLGDAGDDTLIGQAGNDQLDGGPGENRYLPGLGNDIVIGGPDLDVVFLDDIRNNFTGLSACTRSNCSLTYTNAGTTYTLTMSNTEVLIFRDGRYDLR